MEINEKLIADIVSKVIIQQGLADKVGEKAPEFEKDRDPKSGVMSVKTSTVTPERFDTSNPNDQVYLKDIFTLEESPRLGCGVMEMDKTCFDWTLKYDEIDYIIEGTLEIVIDGRKVIGNKGDVIMIPKNTAIQFSVPDHAKFLYVTYPANWEEL